MKILHFATNYDFKIHIWNSSLVQAGYLSFAFITRAILAITVSHSFLTFKVYGITGIWVLCGEEKTAILNILCNS